MKCIAAMGKSFFNVFSSSVKLAKNLLQQKNGQVSSKFAAAKNGQVSSKIAAAKNGQVSSKFAASRKIILWF